VKTVYEPAVYHDWSTSGRDLISHQLDEAEKTELVWNAVVRPLDVVEVPQSSRLLALYTIHTPQLHPFNTR